MRLEMRTYVTRGVQIWRGFVVYLALEKGGI
jgi:hypothetical protein